MRNLQHDISAVIQIFPPLVGGGLKDFNSVS
jgi:hypothetical protein